MNTHRDIELPCQANLATELAALHLRRGMLVMIVQADLSPSDDAIGDAFSGKRHQGLIQLRRGMLRFVRMDTHRSIDPLVLPGKPNSPLAALPIYAERQDSHDTRL